MSFRTDRRYIHAALSSSFTSLHFKFIFILISPKIYHEERIYILHVTFTHQLEKWWQQMGAVAHQSVQLSLKKKKRSRKWSQHAFDTDFSFMCKYAALFSSHNALCRWEFGCLVLLEFRLKKIHHTQGLLYHRYNTLHSKEAQGGIFRLQVIYLSIRNTPLIYLLLY